MSTAPQPRYGWHGEAKTHDQPGDKTGDQYVSIKINTDALWDAWQAETSKLVEVKRDVKYIEVSRAMADRICGDGWSQPVEIRFEQDPYNSALLVMWMRTC